MKMKWRPSTNWTLFRVLLGSALLSVIAVLPYALALQGDALAKQSISLPALLAITLVQNAIILGILIYIGINAGKRVGLGAPILEKLLDKKPVGEQLKRNTLQAMRLGLSVGILIIGFDYIFALFLPTLAIELPALWKGFLASFYGGIAEEIMLRLFMMTAFVWGIQKISRTLGTPATTKMMWTAISLAALLFGILHLPTMALLAPLTPMVVARVIVLNGIGGMAFGWIYWKKGLLAAMTAHFTADIVLHVIFPLIAG